MKNKVHLLIKVVFILLLMYSTSYPCTSFILKNSMYLLMGHNFDWITGTGLLMVNPRGVSKASLVDSTETPVKWISKYGSITFNQVGRDLPFGGINEKGLVIEQMGLNSTIYPQKDHRPAIGACQWIQFQLDNCASIDEVINSDSLIRIVDPNSKFHYLVGDTFGNAAVIEFQNGKMVWYTSKIPVLANSMYSESLECYNNNCNTNNDRSLYNFCAAASQILNQNNSTDTTSIKYAFDILNKVSQGPLTKWSIVFDINNLKIYYKCYETPTIVGERKIFLKPPGVAKIKIVDLKEFSFDCNDAVKVIDIDNSNEAQVNAYFIDYTKEINKEYITKAFTFYKNWGASVELNEDEMNYLADYPESFKCVFKK
ncbi:MAG: linear amide C-N hydrolase [Ignavibacteriales bacterium]|nr:linear amide C-N hydrolase [Ignavibacteriales bacterium]MCF8438512.1 linear amide C-N hydrolase [Ignavibacteriales bacterium]